MRIANNDTRGFIPDLTAPTPKPTGSSYRLVYGGQLPYPGKCTGCGSSYRDCLDLNFQFDQDNVPRDRIGAVLLCVLCFRNAADVMGYVSTEVMMTEVNAARNQDDYGKATAFGKLNKTILEELGDKIEWYNSRAHSILAGDFDTVGSGEAQMDLESTTSDGLLQSSFDEDNGTVGQADREEITEEITEQFTSTGTSSTTIGSPVGSDAGVVSDEGSTSFSTDPGDFGIPGLSELIGRPKRSLEL